MSLAKLALSQLHPFQVKEWYDKNFERLGEMLHDIIVLGNAVLSGGVASAGITPVAVTTLHTAVTDLVCKLAGEIKGTLTGISNLDIMAVAQNPIFSDGGDAVGGTDITLGGAESAYVTLIAANGDGAGGVTGDNGLPKLVAVVAGDATTYNSATAYLSDTEIRQALAASTGKWDGVTGWTRLADILWEGTPAATYTVNRDA